MPSAIHAGHFPGGFHADVVSLAGKGDLLAILIPVREMEVSCDGQSGVLGGEKAKEGL